jgi:hypothetical protein
LPVAGDSWLQIINQAAGRLDAGAQHRRGAASQVAQAAGPVSARGIEIQRAADVLPLDPRQRERYGCQDRGSGRPDLLNGRTSMTLVPGMTRLNEESTVPNVKNTSFTVTAAVTLGAEPTQGAVIAQSGSFGGWCLYFKDGVPAYAHNHVGLEMATVRATQAIGRLRTTSRAEGADGAGHDAQADGLQARPVRRHPRVQPARCSAM